MAALSTVQRVLRHRHSRALSLLRAAKPLWGLGTAWRESSNHNRYDSQIVFLDARLRPVRALRGGALGEALGHDGCVVVEFKPFSSEERPQDTR